MEALIAQQQVTAGQLSRAVTNFRKTSSARKSQRYLNNIIAKVREINSNFIERHAKIVDGLTSGEQLKNPYFDNDVFGDFDEEYFNFKSEIEELLDRAGAEKSENEIESDEQGSSKGHGDSLKLPRISLPKFSGSYDSWNSFRDLYISLIHNRKALSRVEKLQYLKGSLCGEAEGLLRQLPITEKNYDIAWKVLNDRYDNKNALINAQFVKLFATCNASETASSVKGLLDRIVECVQAIENLQVPNLWHAVIIFMTTQRMPRDTRQLWEQNQASKSEIQPFDELKDFLQNRFRALEATGEERVKHSKHITHNRQVMQSYHSTPQQPCVMCREPHFLRQCAQFTSSNYKTRFEIVKRNGLCLNCLSKGHLVANCPSKTKCLKCNRSHHTMLHREIQETIPQEQHVSANASVNYNNAFHITSRKAVLLATALVTVQAPHGKITLRALLDQGSQASFITESAAQQLGLKRNSTTANILGIGNSNVVVSNGAVKPTLLTYGNEDISFDAIVLKNLTELIPPRKIITTSWTQIDNLKLADPHFDCPGKIDLLLGAEIYAQLILGDLFKLPTGPVVQNTRIGWIISGAINTSTNEPYQSFKIEVEEEDLSKLLTKFWELEDVGSERSQLPEDEACEAFYIANTTRGASGRYTTRLPFKNGMHKNMLGASRSRAVGNLLSLERRFAKDSYLQSEYTKCLNSYLHSGYMKASNRTIDVEADTKGELCCSGNYLPHHAVYKESTTTKVRVVFNASHKTSSGFSLNDLLMTGPTIQDEMIAIFLRWRCYRTVVVADIEKMFLQISLHPDDAELQRIVWRSSPYTPVQDYCLNTITFGTTCAPYLAIRTLRKLAEDEKFTFPLAYRAIMEETYVDDLLSGGNTIEETCAKRSQVDSLLKSGGFKLRKWLSNCPTVLDGIPKEDCEIESKIDMNLELGHKTLGIFWYPQADEFSYNIKLNLDEVTTTKRKVLSDIAHLYDPMGWLAPIIVIAKGLMQTLWSSGVSWDEPLTKEIETQWHQFKIDLQVLRSIRIKRWFHTTGDLQNVELHGFSDASKEAYATAIYIVTRADDFFKSSLVMSKTKVKPLKEITIPLLELCGALLLAKTMKKVKHILKMENVKTYLWCDSTTVLAWLKGQPSRWTIFVANRTTQIREVTKDSTWRYVPSKQNPADIASRGLRPQEILKKDLWWEGPIWLRESSENWPQLKSIPPTELEIRKSVLIACVNINKDAEARDIFLEKYSSLSRLIRVTAYCLRFYSSLKGKKPETKYLNVNELETALTFWIKHVQRNAFSEEINNLEQNIPLDKKSKVRKLAPILDKNGILRVGGRLENANAPFECKHPIIIPKKNALTTLLIKKYHMTTMHGGIQLTTNVLRTKYWIIDTRSAVSQFIHRCVTCHKQKAKTCEQLMGNLPSARVNPSRPFTHTGVDYCGPIKLKMQTGRGQRTYKGYVVIFVCMAVKATHLELVSDQTTQSFLAAFRRFVSRRGLCSHIYSDCGTNFVGASSEFEKMFERNRELAEALSNDGIVWHFNPPSTPHFGGLWEAGVKSTKYHLRRVAGDACLTYEELNTVLVKIEACLNSRPLCPINNDPSDFNILTPGHFLIGDALLAAPEDNIMDVNISRLDRWQLTQRITQTFWKNWSTEYLSRLQERPKWLTQQPNLIPGTMVLVKDERLPPYKWPLGRITETHPGKDGLVRIVTIRTKNTNLKRPITKIAPLPIE